MIGSAEVDFAALGLDCVRSEVGVEKSLKSATPDLMVPTLCAGVNDFEAPDLREPDLTVRSTYAPPLSPDCGLHGTIFRFELGRIERSSHHGTGNRTDTCGGAGWDVLFVVVVMDDHAPSGWRR